MNERTHEVTVANSRTGGSAGAIRDALPADLDVSGYVGPYQFPDNSRRRIPGAMYTVIAAACMIVGATRADGAVLVNGGLFLAGGILLAVGLYSISSGWKMTVDEKKALLLATKSVGFPVGHSSAQQVWRGLRSRPTWRLFCYSAEEPPSKRGLVLIDAVNGRTVAQLVEDNPEASATGK